MAPKYRDLGMSSADVDLVRRLLCAMCGSPPHAARACDAIGDVTDDDDDVIGDVKVQRCVGGMLDELRRRHENLIDDDITM